MTKVFDTLAYAEELIAAGVPEKQAGAHAHAFRRWVEDRVATKDDLEALRVATQEDIKSLRVDVEKLRVSTKDDIEALRAATKDDIEGLRAATKDDIEGLRAATKDDIESLRKDLEAKISASEQRVTYKLTVRMGILQFFSTSLIASLMTALLVFK